MEKIILFAAMLPAVVLVWHIYRRDKYQPEPADELFKGFGWGVLSALVALLFAMPFTALSIDRSTVAGCAWTAFCCAAIPEELAKCLCLFLFLRKNKFFDEHMDGIVYAVAVGMGFAGLENVMYLFGADDDWVTVGIARALLAVPAHFAFAVLMGYYFSLWRIGHDRASFSKMLVAPILAHGVYDVLCFSIPISGLLAIALLIVFAFFLHKLRKRCSRLIEAHLDKDRELSAGVQGKLLL